MSLVDDDFFWLVIGNVDDFLIDRRNLDDTCIVFDTLICICFQVSSEVGSVTKSLNRSYQVGLLIDHRVAKTCSPVNFLVHHAKYFRIIQ